MRWNVTNQDKINLMNVKAELLILLADITFNDLDTVNQVSGLINNRIEEIDKEIEEMGDE